MFKRVPNLRLCGCRIGLTLNVLNECVKSVYSYFLQFIFKLFRDMKDSNESSEVTEERMIYHLSKDFIDVIGKPVNFFT